MLSDLSFTRKMAIPLGGPGCHIELHASQLKNKVTAFVLLANLLVFGFGSAQAAVDPTDINEAYARSLAGPGATVHVVSGSIQAAVNAAQPGDVIYVPPGLYAENVQVRTDHLTIVGPRTAVLDGTGLAGVNGIDVRPSAGVSELAGFSLVGLSVRDYARNGVFLRGVNGYQLLAGAYVNNAEYGLFPVRSKNGLIEGNEVSGSNDTGIYVGQSVGAVIRNNHAFDNTTGIEVENSLSVEVRGNRLTDNSIGLASFVLPGLSIPETSSLLIQGNFSFGNNRLNPVTDPDELLSLVPSGVGMLFIGTDWVDLIGNQISGNGSLGVGLISLPPDLAAEDPRVDPFPDFNHFIGNWVVGNGLGPDPKLALLGLPPVDLLWDGSGQGNGWRDNTYRTSYPFDLPLAPVPEPAGWMMLIVGIALLQGGLRWTQNPRFSSAAAPVG